MPLLMFSHNSHRDKQ